MSATLVSRLIMHLNSIFTSILLFIVPTNDPHRYFALFFLAIQQLLSELSKFIFDLFLEYASTAWSPSYICLINLLESVQRSYTKRIPGCSHLSYPERLSLLKLHTLEQRRLFADLIMCYNIIKDNNCIDSSTFFTFSNNKFSRGHPLKLSIPLTKLNTRKYFFANRVIPIWNSLPAETVMAPSILVRRLCATNMLNLAFSIYKHKNCIFTISNQYR